MTFLFVCKFHSISCFLLIFSPLLEFWYFLFGILSHAFYSLYVFFVERFRLSAASSFCFGKLWTNERTARKFTFNWKSFKILRNGPFFAVVAIATADVSHVLWKHFLEQTSEYANTLTEKHTPSKLKLLGGGVYCKYIKVQNT